ncbi:MAG: tetratricopeptide repeat protein [Xanthomonadales bacterium]|nr:tetratricopeptide repeat protein [Xanthomonadales bacterium]
MARYTPADVARMLEWPRSRLYDYIRDGLVQPERQGRHYYFNFQDLVVLRAARELIRSQVPSRRVKKALALLRGRLDGKPLSAVRLHLAGGQVLVREGDWLWEPETGQGQFNFEPSGSAETVAGPADSAPAGDSADHYNQGLDLEEHDPESAIAAYRQAIDMDDGHADAHINLGRLLQQRGQYQQARDHYQQALAIDPVNAIARFNLGTVLEDLGDLDAAMDAYRQATGHLADAHLNLARLYAASGDQQRALRHLKEVHFWPGGQEGGSDGP